MKLPEVLSPQKGEPLAPQKKPNYLLRDDSKLAVDTIGGRVHIEWDPQSTVTPLGQLLNTTIRIKWFLTLANGESILQLNALRQVCRQPDYCADGIRRKGGVSLIWASVGNCGNQCFDAKGEIQKAETLSMRVPMQNSGAEQLVLVMKCL